MKYRVSGIQPVLDHEPGTTFDADLSEIQEARLIAAGAIERVSDEPATPAKGSTPAPDAPEE